MEFIEIDFYDYKIRMYIDNGIQMYLVSDLLRQYNEKHNTKKQFKHYLENKQTQELLQKRCEKTEGRNSGVQANDDQDSKFDIPDVIQYIKTTSFGGANKGYIICEELLHACLMWTDPDFAWDVYTFLTRLRQQDNDYLRKTIEELKKENKELKNRRVPNEYDQQWYYYLSFNVIGETVHIYSQYSSKKGWKEACSKMKKLDRTCIYCVNDIPNGYTFRNNAHDALMSICDKYNGKMECKHHYMIPLDVWEVNKQCIMVLFRMHMKEVRIDLGWRTDLNDLNKE